MRIGLGIFSAMLVALGLWMMASAYHQEAPSPEVQAMKHRVTAKHQPQAGPVAVGFALVAGGVLFFVLLSRR